MFCIMFTWPCASCTAGMRPVSSELTPSGSIITGDNVPPTGLAGIDSSKYKAIIMALNLKSMILQQGVF